MLSLGILFPLALSPLVTQHAVALASSVRPAPHTVRLVVAGEEQEVSTASLTVADLLRERNITAGPDDSIDPSSDTLLVNGMRITYRPAIPLTLVVAGTSTDIVSSAPDVRTLLAQRGIALGPDDSVTPPLDQPLDATFSTVRVIHVSVWTEVVRTRTPPVVEHRLSLALAPTRSKTVSAGSAGVREDLVSYRRTDDDPNVARKVLQSRSLSHGKPKVVLSGIIAYERYAAVAQRGFIRTMKMANAAMQMVATAYTANCFGCSGYTALGVRAGRGIVAVDPRVIPLGTRLYISGYGTAVAGDTGGAIHGYRIDLGFDSTADAMSFGRRSVNVYVLR